MKKKIILIIAVLSASYFETVAQEDGADGFNNLYVGAEYGRSSQYTHFISGLIWVQVDHHFFKFRIAEAFNSTPKAQKEQHRLYHVGCKCNQEDIGIMDVGLLYGRNYRIKKHHQFQFASGISGFTKTDLDEEYALTKPSYAAYEYNKRFTIGVPAEVRYSFHFNRYLAINISASGNANFLKSYFAYSAGVGLGLI